MKLSRLNKSFGDRKVLQDFSLDVEPKGITCFIGPSGCGKTTLLNIVAGIMEADGGEVIRERGETERTGYLFQEPRLLPWMDALGNVSIVLDGDEDAAKRMLGAVGLSDSIHKYPKEMSGGMRQRVAMARAFAFDSNVLLMDEPFQNLDTKLKADLMDVFLGLWSRSRRTVLWVTHDIMEACLVADRIVCLSSSPMKIAGTTDIATPRPERTLENMAGVQAKTYRMLIG